MYYNNFILPNELPNEFFKFKNKLNINFLYFQQTIDTTLITLCIFKIITNHRQLAKGIHIKTNTDFGII